jgi:hypothetical protein
VHRFGSSREVPANSIVWIGVLTCWLVSPAFAGTPDLPPSAGWAIADFDGDSSPDLATEGIVTFGGQAFAGEVTVHLSSTASHSFTVHTRVRSGRVSARDLDGDTNRDLVIETLSTEPLAVWLNDGAGQFREVSIERFRFQLTHDDPRSLGSPRRTDSPSGTDECLRTDVAASLAAQVKPSLSDATATVERERSAPAAKHSGVRTRGPPL